ncbi:MAG: hypothetical protein WAU20_00820 [Dokdonella sp.]|nr:hypothetical protein [Dokdonella sp.]HQY55955.1 hypothetical protein [Dokdonella sp.]
MEDHQEVSVSENLLLIGQAHFIRSVAIPLHEALEDLTRSFPASAEEEAWEPELPQGLYANFTALSGLAGIVLFIGGWAAKKTLDELYETTIKAKVRKVLEDFFRSDTSGKKYGVSLLINKVPERISIVVATVGQDIAEIELGQRQVSSVIARAMDTARKMAVPNTVHLYMIEAGNVNDHPWIYRSLAEAMGHMSNMSPVVSVKPVRLGN